MGQYDFFKKNSIIELKLPKFREITPQNLQCKLNVVFFSQIS